MDYIFKNDLLEGEEILWSGQPENKIFSSSDMFLIPFSLFWGGFAILWETIAIVSGAPIFFCIFGIPFVLVGFYLMFGRFITKMIKNKHTYYAVTNKRVMIYIEMRNRQMHTQFINEIPSISKSVNKMGVGTIRFGCNDFNGGNYDNTGMYMRNGRYATEITAFYDIFDVEKVYKLVNEIKQKNNIKKEV